MFQIVTSSKQKLRQSARHCGTFLSFSLKRFKYNLEYCRLQQKLPPQCTEKPVTYHITKSISSICISVEESIHYRINPLSVALQTQTWSQTTFYSNCLLHRKTFFLTSSLVSSAIDTTIESDLIHNVTKINICLFFQTSMNF